MPFVVWYIQLVSFLTIVILFLCKRRFLYHSKEEKKEERASWADPVSSQTPSGCRPRPTTSSSPTQTLLLSLPFLTFISSFNFCFHLFTANHDILCTSPPAKSIGLYTFIVYKCLPPSRNLCYEENHAGKMKERRELMGWRGRWFREGWSDNHIMKNKTFRSRSL